MQHVLVYADSLTWGIIPNTRRRLPFHERWPGLLEGRLREEGRDVRIVEDCLNGRRTAFNDPYKPGRNGLVGLEQRIEVNSPLAVVVLMLGTNDFQSMHPHRAWDAAHGMAALVDAVRRAPIEPGMPTPRILVVAPPPLREPTGGLPQKFFGGPEKCVGLAEAYAAVAEDRECGYFDSGQVIRTSDEDGVHLAPDQHPLLAAALTPLVAAELDAATA